MQRTHSQDRSPNESITAERLQDFNLDLDDIFSVIDDKSFAIERDTQQRLIEISDISGNRITVDWGDFDTKNVVYIQKVGESKRYTLTYDINGNVISGNFS